MKPLLTLQAFLEIQIITSMLSMELGILLVGTLIESAPSAHIENIDPTSAHTAAVGAVLHR